LCLAMSTSGAGPQLSAPTANTERRMRRTMSERRSFGSLPSAKAARSRSVNASEPHCMTSICMPDSWSRPLSA
jgi:hypothetical protein